MFGILPSSSPEVVAERTQRQATPATEASQYHRFRSQSCGTLLPPIPCVTEGAIIQEGKGERWMGLLPKRRTSNPEKLMVLVEPINEVLEVDRTRKTDPVATRCQRLCYECPRTARDTVALTIQCPEVGDGGG